MGWYIPRNVVSDVGTVYGKAGISRGETRTTLEGACDESRSVLKDRVKGKGKSMVDEQIEAQQCGGQKELHAQAHLGG